MGDFCWLGVSALSVLPCCGTVGFHGMKEDITLHKACATCPQSFCSRTSEEGQRGKTDLPRFTWKVAVNMDVVMVAMQLDERSYAESDILSFPACFSW